MFFELRFSTFLSYLSFDAHAMHSLLDYEKNTEYFTTEYPLFFKNENGLSAIDTALDHNQIHSINLMIEYIVRNQNNYHFAHLFEHNLVKLL